MLQKLKRNSLEKKINAKWFATAFILEFGMRGRKNLN